MQKYPRGSRGSPAKGVVWEDRSAGSNPAFCAKKGRPTGRPFLAQPRVREPANCRGFARRARKDKRGKRTGVSSEEALRAAQNAAVRPFLAQPRVREPANCRGFARRARKDKMWKRAGGVERGSSARSAECRRSSFFGAAACKRTCELPRLTVGFSLFCRTNFLLSAKNKANYVRSKDNQKLINTDMGRLFLFY